MQAECIKPEWADGLRLMLTVLNVSIIKGITKAKENKLKGYDYENKMFG